MGCDAAVSSAMAAAEFVRFTRTARYSSKCNEETAAIKIQIAFHGHLASKGKLSEDAGRKMFQQLVDSISYCHNRGVFYQDLKLENVLVDA